MKKLILGLLLLVCFNGWGQNRERIIKDSTTQYDLADEIYGNLQRLVPSRILFNRLLVEDTLESVVWRTDSVIKNKEYGATADFAYGLLYELQLMSFDTSSVPSRMDVYKSVSKYVGKNEFEEEEYYYPIGIFDYQYNSMDEQLNKRKGNIILKNSDYYPQSEKLVLEKHQTALSAPLFDLYASSRMAIIFKKEYFFSNYRNVDEVKSIIVTHNEKTYRLNFGEIFYFEPDISENQIFQVQVTYYDRKVISNYMTIHTPELKDKNEAKGLFTFSKCAMSGNFKLSRGEELKYCMIPGCGNSKTHPRIFKPYILVTGYRPPGIGQTFKKTWKIYNSEHHHLLDQLNENGYDVFLVKFNMYELADKVGMLEASELLEDFILWVNEQKGGQYSGQENIIQGCSMGESIANLTLLRMERKHFEDNSYPNHHTRLNISYDGNFYGGNIPLSYQAQIISAMYNPSGASITHFLATYLYSAIQQKATKELLTYHILSGNENIFHPIHQYVQYEPSYHWRRAGFLAELDLQNNNYASTDGHTNFIPIPNATRNIAISLGHNITSNSSNEGLKGFLPAGAYWRDINVWGLWQYKLAVAKYTPPSNPFLLFKRRRFGLFHPPVDQELKVYNMREVDNPSGSYIGGAGNIVKVADWAYFPISAAIDGKRRATHKSVLTALAINKNLWPTDGSMTMNMKNLGLMYNKFDIINNPPSKYYGYPNLGRPNDHFEVTPFEAIFVGDQVQPHIRLNEANWTYVETLTNYILNEVEPWYLGLQNTNLGAQARSDYRYYSYRRARNQIIVGESVTPTTDFGEYTVEPNGKLTLKAGDEILIMPGVHFKAGSIVHIVPEYHRCVHLNSIVDNGGSEDNEQFEEVRMLEPDNNRNKQLTFKLYPNPVSEVLTIESVQQTNIDKVSIYNLNGRLCLNKVSDQKMLKIRTNNLDKGVYIVKIYSHGEMVTRKLIVL